jgi:catechol 2,3-dioxygenase-like lactoylglutathione lyase family enzyme
MVTERFDTYGFPVPDLEAARRFTEARLELRLRRRDSSYRGEYYALRLPDDGDIQLYANEFEGIVQVSRYADYGVLLELARLPDMDSLGERLLAVPSSIVLLTSRSIEVATEDDGDDA